VRRGWAKVYEADSCENKHTNFGCVPTFKARANKEVFVQETKAKRRVRNTKGRGNSRRQETRESI
jgi:hypothetical protein